MLKTLRVMRKMGMIARGVEDSSVLTLEQLLVLDLIFSGVATQTEISRVTGLGLAYLSKICAYLELSGLIRMDRIPGRSNPMCVADESRTRELIAVGLEFQKSVESVFSRRRVASWEALIRKCDFSGKEGDSIKKERRALQKTLRAQLDARRQALKKDLEDK